MKTLATALVAFCFCLSPQPIHTQTQTVGLFLHDSTQTFRGYTLFAPVRSRTTYLIDNNGQLVHKWLSAYTPGQMAYLLENGQLLRAAYETPYFNAGGVGGIVQKLDWDGTILWQYEYATTNYQQHHDVRILPNGNVLMIAWERKTAQQAINAGRNPSLLSANQLWPDHIIEVQQTGTNTGQIVWEWHVWDHLVQDYDSTKPNYGVVADHPELINVNYVTGPGGADWNHSNAIDYNPIFDEILLSVHAFSEIWVIDHGTTTQEAAGHTGGRHGRGGDVLYRWGNPAAYNKGTLANQKLFRQHNAQWITTGLPGTGSILIFNNGQGRTGGNYSSIDEIVTPVDTGGNYTLNANGTFGPEQPTWSYIASPPSSFYAVNISGASRQPNGNTLICSGPSGTFFEVTSTGTTVWKYINPVTSTGPLTQGQPVPPNENLVFRCSRYAPNYAGLLGRTLTPQGTIEIYPTGANELTESPSSFELLQNYPNPVNPTTRIVYRTVSREFVQLNVFDVLGRIVAKLVNEEKEAGKHTVDFHSTDLSSGVYFYQLRAGQFTSQRKMLLLR